MRRLKYGTPLSLHIGVCTFPEGLDGEAHNFYFTLEMHGTFVYIPGLTFTFRGDDDVWVYMNGKLVIDLGGVHNPMVGTYEIDNLNLTEGRRSATSGGSSNAIRLKLCPRGESVDLSFFFAERRCCGSEFRMETSIVPVKGTCTIWGLRLSDGIFVFLGFGTGRRLPGAPMSELLVLL